MTATYQIAPNELNHFIESLRKSFGGSPLKITVEELDETEYLLSTQDNRNHLEDAIKRVDTEQNFVELSFEKLHEMRKI
jgi:antitoxin YefM